MFPCLAGHQPSDTASEPISQPDRVSKSTKPAGRVAVKSSPAVGQQAGAGPSRESIQEPAGRRRRMTTSRNFTPRDLIDATSLYHIHAPDPGSAPKPLMTVCHHARDIRVNCKDEDGTFCGQPKCVCVRG